MSNKLALSIVLASLLFASAVILAKLLWPQEFKCYWLGFFARTQSYNSLCTEDLIERIDRTPMSNGYCIDLLKSFPIEMMNGYSPLLMNRLISACEHRWNQLSEQTHPKYSVSEDYGVVNKTLIVLDLDKTMLDQETVIITKPTSDSFNYSLIKTYNEKGLKFNRIYTNSNRDHLVVYAPNLMEMIRLIHEDENYGAVIYSFAQNWVVIYNAIFIEMYYNYIHSANDRNAYNFQFKAVVSRIVSKRVNPLKSMHILKSTIDLNVYSDIVLVDDSPEVWNKSLPQGLIDRTNIVPVICAPKFQLSKSQIRMRTGGLTALLKRVSSAIERDRFFEDLVEFLSNQEQRRNVRSVGDQMEWVYMFADNRHFTTRPQI